MFKGVIFVVKQIESTNTKPCNYHPLECNTFWNQIRVHSICKLGPCSEHYGSSEFSLHTWLGRLGDKKWCVILALFCVTSALWDKVTRYFALFCFWGTRAYFSTPVGDGCFVQTVFSGHAQGIRRAHGSQKSPYTLWLLAANCIGVNIFIFPNQIVINDAN